ncbi:cytochrome b5 type B [Paramuricea clavata]|uniref:Cytochrome b5 n=1 Tax=Paramuricea clavata TaxID=317549 RepID=A0A6S7J137_PARCT|nr:cytochrome b5 type B [Paramuricea clavata]
MSSTKRLFTLKEISKHNSPGNIWIVVHGKVYNISKFITEHPGGEIPLFDKAGEDATEAFDNIGHSEEAKHLMKEYYIGDIYDDADM